jgi:hypothetical protein
MVCVHLESLIASVNERAQFLGCVLESFGYGLLTVMTGFTLNSLWGNKQTRYPSRLLLTVLALIWVLSTGVCLSI